MKENSLGFYGLLKNERAIEVTKKRESSHQSKTKRKRKINFFFHGKRKKIERKCKTRNKMI